MGFVLMDSSLKCIYANAEAVKILTYPARHRRPESVQTVLTEKIRAVFRKKEGDFDSSFPTHIQSGRRRYVCQVFSLAPSSKKGSQPAMALLLERNSAALSVFRMAGEFHLTVREREAVEHLAQGLTSKEIASRMGISPNTVKAFLHLVLIKTGVSTRSGIIGKFLQNRF